MPELTPRLGIKKPLGNENVTRLSFNENWDIIDAGVVIKNEFNAHLADNVSHVPYAVATGLANTYAVTLNPAPAAYTDGMAISVKINVDSTGASTLNVNGLGAKPLKKANGNDVTNLKANGVYTFRYNASTGNFILQGEGGEYGTAGAADVLSGKTIGTENGIVNGTMSNNGAIIITPGTSDQPIPAGYHNGSGIVKGDPDLIPANIKQGVDIFGVVGTLIPGKRFASGTGRNYQSTSLTISGLTFSPSFIILEFTNDYGNIFRYVYNQYNTFHNNSFLNYNPGNSTVIASTSTSWTIGATFFTLNVAPTNANYSWYAFE